MLRYKCPSCSAIVGAAQWNEETAELLGVSAKKIAIAHDSNGSRKYKCPSCHVVVDRGRIVAVDSTNPELSKLLFKAGMNKYKYLLNDCRARGIVADYTYNFETGTMLTRRLGSAYIVAVKKFGGASRETCSSNDGSSLQAIIKVVPMTMLYCKVMPDNSIKSTVLAELVLTIKLSSMDISAQWLNPRGDGIGNVHDVVDRHRKKMLDANRKPPTYTPPRAILGDDGRTYVTFPSLEGGQMQTMLLEEFLIDPLNNKKNFTFDEFLTLLSDSANLPE